MDNQNLRREIIKEVTINSWLDEGEHDETELNFETRRHGDMSSDEPGPADQQEAVRIGKIIKQKYPDAKCKLDSCDEWTYLRIKI